MSKEYTIGVAIITYKAAAIIENCLKHIKDSNIKIKILVVNSSSNDGTVELAEQLGVETLIIPRNEFNHGATRELARKTLNTDIVVMMTPDAIPVKDDFIEKLVKPIQEGIASVAYSRQIPHDNATIFEAFPRKFNYPDESQLRSIKDINIYGAFTFFCSDTCAAWLNSALDEVGGFFPIILGEDTFMTSLLLKKGDNIAYIADSVVKHSHKYKLKQEFNRNFDNGYVRGIYQKKLFFGLKDEGRGMLFMKEFFKEIIKKNIIMLPYGFLQICFKYAGYKIGFYSKKIPLKLKKKLSSQDFYWDSLYYDRELYK